MGAAAGSNYCLTAGTFEAPPGYRFLTPPPNLREAISPQSLQLSNYVPPKHSTPPPSRHAHALPSAAFATKAATFRLGSPSPRTASNERPFALEKTAADE